jgi:hypothetical protein
MVNKDKAMYLEGQKGWWKIFIFALEYDCERKKE